MCDIVKRKTENRQKHIEYIKECYDVPNDVLDACMRDYDNWERVCANFDRKSDQLLHLGATIESPEACGHVSVPPPEYLNVERLKRYLEGRGFAVENLFE